MIVAASAGFAIFIMEVQCVYCGVGIEYLSVIWICMRSDVLTAVLLHGQLFCYIIPCRVGNTLVTEVLRRMREFWLQSRCS
jgi:hypothetical protein